MKKMFHKLMAKAKRKSGQTLVEYVLIVALIAVAAIVGMKILGGGINSRFTNVNSIIATP